MSEFITQNAKLLPRIKRIKPVPGFATAYNYEPDQSDNSGLGQLYVVIEVLSNPKPAEAVTDLVIESLGNAYFNNSQSDESIMDRFEAAVKATNQALEAYANSGNASWVGRMSAIAAVVAGNELHITQAGSAEAFLYRGSVTSHISSDLADRGPNRPITTFANIASGELEAHDRLLIATPALFHQMQQQTLKTIINDNSAAATIRKLSELIPPTDADRIAAIVVEITTPELLAQQVRSDEPAAVEIGEGDKPFEVAKSMATPAVKSLVETSKSVGARAATQTKEQLIPKVKSAGYKTAESVRGRLSSRAGRRQILLVLVIFVIVIIGFGYWIGRGHHAKSQLSRYNSLYLEYAAAQTKFSNGDKSGARTSLAQLDKDLKTLADQVSEPAFDQQLAHQTHPVDDPASVSKLEANVTALINQIDQVVQLSATTLVDFSKLKNVKPTQLELVGNKLLLIDGQGDGSVRLYDLSSKTFTTPDPSPTGIGKVVATTPSNDGTGIYLLTDQPQVWFVRALDGMLTKLTLTFGNWPAGRAIANYNGSLYILAADSSQIYKLVPTPGGFNAPANYFSDGSVVGGSTAMAIDGSIYLGGGASGLRQFIAGKLATSLTSPPDSLSHPISLHPIAINSQLLSLDGSSDHLGLFDVSDTAITFQKQYIISGATTVYAATINPSGNQIYALTNGRLVTATLPQ